MTPSLPPIIIDPKQRDIYTAQQIAAYSSLDYTAMYCGKKKCCKKYKKSEKKRCGKCPGHKN